MSVRAMSHVWELRKLGSNRKFILLKLADYADDDGSNIFPSVATVAAECDASERSVQRVIKEFLKDGVLILVEKERRGRGRNYRIDFIKAREVYSCTRDRGDNLSPQKADGVTSCHPNARLGDTGDVLGCQALSPKPSGTDEEEEESARGSPGDRKFEDIVRAEAVHERCLQIIGVDRSWPGMRLHRAALEWLGSGCDPEHDIYPAVEASWGWMKSKGRQPPKAMSYFTNPVLKARDERLSFNQENAADQRHGTQNQAARPETDQGLIRRIAARHRREP